MKRDSRLSGVLHILLHMAEVARPLTSEQLAKMMQTHAVVIRRGLAGLREQGFVSSEKGHGGGWRLACNLKDVTLYDIYNALGNPPIFSLGHRSESPGCLVEKAVNRALDESFEEAESLLLTRFKQVTLAQLSEDFHQQMQQRDTDVCSSEPVPEPNETKEFNHV